MKYGIIFAVLASLIFVSLPVHASNLTGNAYLPYPDGGSIQYRLTNITSMHYTETTGSLDVVTWGTDQAQDQTITFSAGPACARIPDVNMYNLYYHNTGSPNQPAQSWASLDNGLDTYGGVAYYGEYYGGVASNYTLKDPAEPELEANFTVGRTIDQTNVTVYDGCDLNSSVITTTAHHTYHSIAYYPNGYGSWTGEVVRSSLREHGNDVSNCGNVYNYWYEKNVGMVGVLYAMNIPCNTMSGPGIWMHMVAQLPPDTPTPTASNTPTPTETPTPTVSSTPTETPTAEPTATETPTSSGQFTDRTDGQCYHVTSGWICFYPDAP